MTISQTTITGSIRTPSNIDAKVKSVVFTLSGSDFENGEIIAVRRVEAECNAENGDFSVTLWPNSRGLRGNTIYSTAFKLSDGSSVTGIGDLYVRHSDTPVTLEDVAAMTRFGEMVRPYGVQIVDRPQFDALSVLDPSTIYLVKG